MNKRSGRLWTISSNLNLWSSSSQLTCGFYVNKQIIDRVFVMFSVSDKNCLEQLFEIQWISCSIITHQTPLCNYLLFTHFVFKSFIVLWRLHFLSLLEWTKREKVIIMSWTSVSFKIISHESRVRASLTWCIFMMYPANTTTCRKRLSGCRSSREENNLYGTLHLEQKSRQTEAKG